MTIPGEIGHIGHIGSKCMDCGSPLPAQVLHSAAGYYVGTFCENCGPYSRESGYYKTRKEAEEAMKAGGYVRI